MRLIPILKRRFHRKCSLVACWFCDIIKGQYVLSSNDIRINEIMSPIKMIPNIKSLLQLLGSTSIREKKFHVNSNSLEQF